MRRQGRHWKPSTRESKAHRIDRYLLPFFGAMRVAEINRADVRHWFDSLNGPPGNASRTLPVLSVMMGQAELWDLRPQGSNPCRNMRRYRTKPRERFLSADELRRFGFMLDHAEERQTAAAVRLLLFTGAVVRDHGPAVGLDTRHPRRPNRLKDRAEDDPAPDACANIVKNPRQPVTRYLDHQELDRLGAVLDRRRDEIGELSDEGASERLEDTKTGPRTIRLGPEAARLLKALPQKEGAARVFPEDLTSARLYTFWVGIRGEAGLPRLRIHNSTAATLGPRKAS